MRNQAGVDFILGAAAACAIAAALWALILLALPWLLGGCSCDLRVGQDNGLGCRVNVPGTGYGLSSHLGFTFYAPAATPTVKPLTGSVAKDLSGPSRYEPARPPREMAIGAIAPANAAATARIRAFRLICGCSATAAG